jgi:hypothetical protein
MPLTATERRILAGCPEQILKVVAEAKEVFEPLGGLDVVRVQPFKSECRDEAARLIRNARRSRGRRVAAAMRKAWREQIEVCMGDDELDTKAAERVALEELRRNT